jgi:Ser-tRNA(Ala) deacylase AlaX
MATKLLYLEDFGVMAAAAHVLAVETQEDGRVSVVLDATCFYPRGGGQDWDTGVVQGADAEFVVEEVRLDEQGVVRHIGRFAHGTFAASATVACQVNEARRAINTRLHSAGHLVDMAVDRLGLPWTPSRGAHYPHMSFVEYGGKLDPAQAETVRAEIEQVVQKIIAAGGENEIRFIPVEHMHTVCRHVPENIPRNKPARVVIYPGNFGIPCGGTHVKNLAGIGTVTIPKVKSKKGVIKVSYAVAGIN